MRALSSEAELSQADWSRQIDEILGRRGPDPYLPHLLGHEGAGVVTEMGPGVRKVKPGDKVVLHWMKGSGIDGAPANFRTTAGRHINAGCITTFSESTVVAENRITRIAAGTRGDVASLLGCAVTTGLGIVFNNANLKPGEYPWRGCAMPRPPKYPVLPCRFMDTTRMLCTRTAAESC